MGKTFSVQIDIKLKEIFPTYLSNRQNDLKVIKLALQVKDLAKIEAVAHKLAGNAGSYGLTALGEMAFELEAACQREDLLVIKAKYEQFLNYMKNLQIEYS